MPTKYVFVTGGVISGLGKGITTASIANLLTSSGIKVSVLKADMYLNVDAGTMNPLVHGETYVTDDGLETDQDLGHYERFLNRSLSKHNYMTMGQVYYDVLNHERSMGYEGKCVEGHIHIPQEIIRKIKDAAKKDKAEIMFIEVGGTVGEYQNIMFFEAMRRMKQQDHENVFLIHLVYLITPKFLGEMKSKPAQASIYELYKLGLQPDFVVCRSNLKVDEKRINTIAFNTGIKKEHIISAEDVDSIYEVPLLFKKQNFDKKLLKVVGIRQPAQDTAKWEKLNKTIKNTSKPSVKIAIAGKYFKSGDFCLEDSYVCVIEAIKHAAWAHELNPEIKWFDVEEFENPKEIERIKKELLGYDGVIVPQGWGSRGVEGKIKCVQFVRENKIPYLGLCFGMQMAVIEFARNVLGIKNATSEEIKPTAKDKVIHIMPNQKKYLEAKQYGGTIRLGSWPCKLKKSSIIQKAYEQAGKQSSTVQERHRHRYEVNNTYADRLKKHGLVFSGKSPDGRLVEAVELPKAVHPFFVGTQFHPEYKSRPLDPHPIFLSFIKACKK